MAIKWILFMAALGLGVAGCTSENDPVVPDNPPSYSATGSFFNLLAGDGSVDTRTSFRKGTQIKLGDHILPNGSASDRTFSLTRASSAVTFGFFLTEGDGTVLNPGEVFNLNNRGDYVFLALGDVGAPGGQTRPTLLMMDTLAEPDAGQVRFRFSHALAGWTGAVDVYVNGMVLENVRYGHEFSPVDFEARTAGLDTLIVVPTGESPDGPYPLWKSQGSDLFDAGDTIEALLVHEPYQNIHGDVAGDYQVEFSIR